ncbi:WD repeat-containing protein 87 [Plakobranchus ocellatus]|uniref:WD repeat-containing protein 87 n=1 Tax=Plakobranchus ocellatus TaxID=259542 RepID=A0AAV4A3X4_9GAST|nr:WD repeat-containing protein 87 [Plakobranchus ocellatus]
MTAQSIVTYSLKKVSNDCTVHRDLLIERFYSTFTSCTSGVAFLKRLRSHGHGPNKIMVSTEDGRLQLFNPVTGALVSAMLPLPKHQVVEELAYNAKDGKMYIVLKSGDVLVLNTHSHPFRAVEVLHPPTPDFKVVCLTVMVVCIESTEAEGGKVEDTVIFMGTSSGAICVMESQSLLMETPIQAHKGGFVAMSCSCDVDPVSSRLHRTSRYLVTAGNDNLVKLWGLEFMPGQGGWTLSLVLVQNIDCMGSPSHVAMFENIVCVTFGEYGLVKMFRLAGLNKKDNRSELQGLYVLLTHFSQFDHSDTVTALDMCPMINIFVTCGTDGYVKIWDTNNQLIREMAFGQTVHSVCFANNRGDLLIGFQNRVLLVPIIKYMPQFMLEQMSGRMFVDEEQESPVEISGKKKKLW